MTTEINHHPDEATLMSYSAGTLAEPLAAVVAAHVSMCSRCRADVADMELLGATLLLSEPVAGGSLAVPKRPMEVSVAGLQRAASEPSLLPHPIAAAYGLSLDTIPWKRLGPGVWHHKLPLTASGSGDLRLLRIGPGRAMPDHGHGGSELTLVLDGAYSDITGTYRRGDIQDVDEEIDHKPVVDKGGECICLIASEHPARFKSLIGRLIQPFTGM